MKKDIKYIIKRILIGVGIILVMSFINSCQVHAETLMLTNSDISFNNTAGVNYYFNLNAGSTTDINIKFSYSGTYSYTTLVLDVCSGTPLTNSANLYRKYAAGSSCPNSCFSNNIVRKDLGTSCTNSNGYSTNSYRIYLPIVKLDYGAGCGQSGCYPSLNDTITFKNNYSWWTFADINGAYLTDELTDITDNTAINKVDTDINNLNNSVNNAASQAHTDSQNTQSAINNAASQAHTDSQNTQSAINDVNDSINDDSIPSDSENKINNITNTIKANQNSYIVQIATFIPQTLQVILNGFNTNCAGGYSLGSLYGTELTIPCINPVNYLGSFLWGVIDSILCLCYLIPLCKFLVNKYNDLTSMKNLRWQ